eukprot:TRINITY_DN11253_c0_g1_i1.p1 TRINITY_DN11253_c0_g1~~TRINITY_DN11253_c0_g1_i1.p1  ORF type:complete len:141 (+),score=13.09 TRINITY_DN11253_c0_g1_i1:34-423(+)
MEAILQRWQVHEKLLVHPDSQLANKEATLDLVKRCFDEDQVGSLDCRMAASRIISEQMRIAMPSVMSNLRGCLRDRGYPADYEMDYYHPPSGCIKETVAILTAHDVFWAVKMRKLQQKQQKPAPSRKWF